MLECLRYLRYRYKFSKGIFAIDLGSLQDFAAVHEILDNLRVPKDSVESKADDTRRHSAHGRKSVKKMNQRRDKRSLKKMESDLLIIFDNVDEFMRRN